MAEQYQSFQGKEPNIEVDLFIKKAAQEETVRAAKTAELQRGLQLGIQGYEAYSQGQLRNKQGALIEAQTAAIEQKTAGGGADPQEVLKNKQAEQKLGDMSIFEQLSGIVKDYAGGNRALDINSTFSNPALGGTFARNKDQSLALLEQARQAGLAPEVYDSQVKPLFAEKAQEQEIERKAYDAKLDAASSNKQQDEVLNANAILSPNLKKIPGAKPEDFGFAPRSRLSIGADNRVELRKDGRYEEAGASGEARDDNVMYYKKDGTIVGMGLPDERRKDLDTMQRHQALNPNLYGPSQIGGVTEDQALGQRRSVDTSGNFAGGLAGRATVDLAPTANTIEGRAQRALESADAGINKILGGSPTASAVDTIKRGIQEGKKLSNKNINTATSFQPTTVPLPANTAYITKASFNPEETMKASVGSIQYAKDHLSNVLSGADVEINLPEKYIARPPRKGQTEPYIIEPEIVERIKNDPMYKGLPAKVLGMIAIESGGNPAAYNKGTDAAGAMQLTEAAAIDGGIDPSLSNRLNQEQNVKGGTAYLQRIGADIARTYANKAKELQKNSLALGAFTSSTGQIQKLDPRAELLAYNGGASYVKAAIRAGKVSWNEMEQYIRDVKHTAAEEENIGYANKVIAASLLFIEGGNTSDEAYVNELLQTGIITATPKKPAGTYV